MKYVLEFEQITKALLPVVGGKNASLGEMLKAGMRVPPGFAVTTDSYLEFLTKAGIANEINNVLAAVNPDDIASLNSASAKIRGLIEHATMPSAIADAIRKSYASLCEKCQVKDLPVAVRSSATAEDLPTASFAGQQDTYLWVKGADQVIRWSQSCWASLFTSRAISYRARMNFPHDKVLISVGVQKMVNSRTAGVMFTLNPVNGDLSRVVIEGSWGLGETVVSGTVTPDKFVVDKVVFEISERTISPKIIECVHDAEKGVIHCEVPSTRQDTPCVDDREIKELAKIAKQIEDHYGSPQDIEWAIDKDFSFPENIFIVQSRPETVWSQRPREPVLGRKTGYELLMEEALKTRKVRL
ncbi:MAG: PEP/pyruvate-binding domain-containing protein [Anaerolineae bacterium]